MKRYIGWGLLVVAGAAFYLAFERSAEKAAALVFGSLLIDIGIDMALLRYEERKKGED